METFRGSEIEQCGRLLNNFHDAWRLFTLRGRVALGHGTRRLFYNNALGLRDT